MVFLAGQDHKLNEKWYSPPRNATDLQQCHVNITAPAAFFRGFSWNDFQYPGHRLAVFPSAWSNGFGATLCEVLSGDVLVQVSF